MKYNLLILILFNLSLNGYGQKELLEFSDLPRTKQIAAPEFNTFAKYNISIDSLHQNVYIQDVRKSAEGKLHFYQWLYEFPLVDLIFEPEVNDENEILIKIRTTQLDRNFYSYMFQDNKVSSLLNRDYVVLGKWENTSENLKEITECSSALTKYFSSFNMSKSNVTKNEVNSFKYIADNVEQVNTVIDSNSSLGSHQFSAFFDENGNPKSQDLFKKLNKRTSKSEKPVVALIFSNINGEVENIQLISPDLNFSTIIDDLKSKGFIPTGAPTKNVFLIY